MLIVVAALPFLIAVTVVFEQMIKGMRKADAKAEASMVNRAIKKVKLFAITRDLHLRLRGRVQEAKLSVDAPAPAPSPTKTILMCTSAWHRDKMAFKTALQCAVTSTAVPPARGVRQCS